MIIDEYEVFENPTNPGEYEVQLYSAGDFVDHVRSIGSEFEADAIGKSFLGEKIN